MTHKPNSGSLISNRTRSPLGERSSAESLIIGCLIIYVFPIYVRVFLRMLPAPVFKTTTPPPSMSATPRYPSIASPSLSILASSTLICMRAVLRSALIARRGHLGIKKCQSPEQYQATTQFPVQPNPQQPQPQLQSTNHYYFIPSLESVKNCIMHKLSCRLAASC